MGELKVQPVILGGIVTRQRIRRAERRVTKDERNARKAAKRTVQPQKYQMNRATRRGLIKTGLTPAASKTLSYNEAILHLSLEVASAAL